MALETTVKKRRTGKKESVGAASNEKTVPTDVLSLDLDHEHLSHEATLSITTASSVSIPSFFPFF